MWRMVALAFLIAAWLVALAVGGEVCRRTSPRVMAAF